MTQRDNTETIRNWNETMIKHQQAYFRLLAKDPEADEFATRDARRGMNRCLDVLERLYNKQKAN